jgi:uncharacterized protein involved in response to NO
MNAVPRLSRHYAGPSLLSYGFRTFFLLAPPQAALVMLFWLPIFYREISVGYTNRGAHRLVS